MRSAKSAQRRQAPYLEIVEPRILYSADFAASLLDASASEPQEEQRLLDSSGEYAPSLSQVSQAFAELALSFEANVGQTDGGVDFLARGAGYQVYLAGGDAIVVLAQGDGGHVVQLGLVGADASALPTGQEPAAARSNYLLGDDPAQWRTDIAHFGRVHYAQVYEGVDLVYYGNQARLEYDFVVAAGADPGQIRFRLEGADAVQIDAGGDLVLRLGEREIRFLAPVSYQDGPAGREAVASRYTLLADGSVGFALGDYDAGRALVIDPVLSYFTYLGGSLKEDLARGIALDGAGNVYLAGQTKSTDFPATVGAYKSAIAPTDFDAYVVKFDPSLGSLVYATYLGGTAGLGEKTMANAIAVDSAGNAWITGWTKDASFPTTGAAVQSALAGAQDAFVAKLDSSGAALLYSTFLGGSGNIDAGRGIALDAADGAYVVGSVAGAGFVTTAGAVDVLVQGEEAFLAKFSPAGALVYATLLGGAGDDAAYAVAVDGAGSVYVAGTSSSATSLTFTGSLVPGYDPLNDGGFDAFVAKLNVTAGAYEYFTFLGGSGNETARALTVDAAGRAYVAGETASAAFPVTADAYDLVAAGIEGFVTVLDAAGTSLGYSSYFGGDGSDVITGIGVDAGGRIYLAGHTDNALGFPTALEPLAGGKDLFVAQLDPAGAGTAGLLYVDLHGGAGDELAHAALLAGQRFYIAGETTSSALATAGAFQSTYSAGDPLAAFAAVYAFTEPPLLAGSSTLSYLENDAPLAINPALTVSDADSATLSSGRVALANFVAGEDLLWFANDGATMGNISGSYDAASGVLSLASAGAGATLAQWQAALRAVRYSNSSDNPNTATRDVTFTVHDGDALSNTVGSTIAITAVNDAPVSSDDWVASDEDVKIILALSDFGAYSDAEGDPLAAIQITALPTDGILAIDNNGIENRVSLNQVISAADIAAGRLRFTPEANASGAPYASIGFRVSDGMAFSAAAYTLTIGVNDVNDAPVSTDDRVVTAEDTTAVLGLADFGAYSDPEGTPLAAVRITSLPGAGSLEYNGAALALNQVISAADIAAGKLRFTPGADASGTGYALIGFRVSDGALFSAAAYTLTVDVTPVNDAPVSSDASASTQEDTPLVLSLSEFGSYADVEGDPLAAVRITALPGAGVLEYDNAGTWQPVASGQVIGAADIAAGRLRFSPAADANGAGYASIGFQVGDGTDFSASAYTLSVDVSAVNDAPVARADSLAAIEDTPVSFSAAQLLGNDFDVDGDSLAIAAVASGSGGTAVLNADGSVSFTPDADFFGVAEFTYRVTDGSVISVAATVSVDVAPVNDAPVSSDGAASIAADRILVLTLADFGSYRDVEGSPLAAVQITALPAAGTLQYQSAGAWQPVAPNQVVSSADIAAGRLRFAPTAGSVNAAVGFKVSDGAAFSAASYTLAIEVTAATTLPTPLPSVPPAEPGETPAQEAPAPQQAALASSVSLAAAGNGHGGSVEALLGAALPQESFGLRTSEPVVSAPEALSALRFQGRAIDAGGLPAEVVQGLEAVFAAGSQAAASSILLLQDFLSGSSKDSPFVESLDRLRDAIEQDARLEDMVSVAGAVAGLSFSVGYVVWLVRGGILVTSLLSSLPAWRMLDPLPILPRLADEEDERYDEEGIAA